MISLFVLNLDLEQNKKKMNDIGKATELRNDIERLTRGAHDLH